MITDCELLELAAKAGLAHRKAEPVAWMWRVADSDWQLESTRPPARPLAIVEPLYTGYMADAYIGAMEEVEIWKRRALEAEEKLRAEIARLTAENEAVHDAVADASTPSSAPRGGKFIPTAINMKLFKEGDKSKAICSFCKDVVSTTFKHRDVPFSDGIGVAKNILVSVCDCCGQVVATPPQSTPAIRLSRAKA